MVSMRTLPYGGSTFGDWRISEAGRVFLADLLRQLSREQIRGLFTGARVAAYPKATVAARNVDNWVAAFQAKVNAFVNRSACP
jgi:Na+-transporting methylmalonyl-CoA/oxaloacetate decarboxylase beta subunit